MFTAFFIFSISSFIVPSRVRISVSFPNTRHRASCRTLGGVDDGREGHDRQSDVRDVVQERLDELVFDRLPDEGQRQDADGVGYGEHHYDVKPVAANHCSASSLWVLTGNNSAPAQEMATVRMMVRVPSDRAEMPGR